MRLIEDQHKLLHCKTRLENHPNLNFNVTHPILLQTFSHFINLIIYHYHKENFHSGVYSTLNLIRHNFWIITGRQRVKNVLKNCYMCKYLQKQSSKGTEAGDLPLFRMSCEHAFQNIGVDFLGPLYFKSVNNKMQKCYILLFTRAVVRAVHLELTLDIGTNSVILALRRFIGRRRKPSVIIIDNFKSFKSTTLKNFLALKGIKWQFILERSPWWGGFYERLVDVVKNSL